MDFICTEVIVTNPIEFVEVVLHNECYISEIRWWDRAKISFGSTIGYGGPRDPNFPNEYYFAETDICKSFSVNTTAIEYKKYLIETKSNFQKYDLFPAFDVKLI